MPLIKFPSVESLWEGIADTAKRFPLPLLCAFINFSISVYLLGYDRHSDNKAEDLYKIMMCVWIGLNLFISTVFYSESKRFSYSKTIILQLAGLALLVLYYFSMPEKFNVVHVTRYVLFNLGLHLLVSFSPFISRGHINGFWQFNKTLFLRFLTAALYTGVLYLGLCGALLAIHNLFDLDIEGETYVKLWFFLSMVFNTWFFLSGIPKNLQQLDYSDSYPKGLKIFTQFVLLPLVSVYLFILYAYTLKIISQMELPCGWVAYLVIGFSIAGILSLLLIYPIRNLEGNTWIRVFSRWFYRALYPLIILLFVAIYERLNQYGITENRYFVLLLAFWLAGIATYFLLSKKENIKVIPISLCILAFLSSFGPWGAFSVSEKSQVNRLENLLVSNNILVDGKIKKTDTVVPEKDANEIHSIVYYLDKSHGYDEIQSWFNQELDSVLKMHDYYKAPEVLKLMGVIRSNDSDIRDDSFNFHTRRTDTYSISGYDYYTTFNGYAHINKIELGTDSLFVNYFPDKNLYSFKKDEKVLMAVSLTPFLEKLVKSKRRNMQNGYGDVENELMNFEYENSSLKVKFIFNNFSGRMEKEKVKINNIHGILLLKIK